MFSKSVQDVAAMLFVVAVIVPNVALAASPSRNCEAAKLKAAAKYTLCRLKADAKAAKRDEVPDYSRCDEKYLAKWPSLDTPDCAVNGDMGSVQAEAVACTEAIQNVVGGGSSPGHVFVDNGDGTITDTATGLQWEKQNGSDNVANPSNPHDVDNRYVWSGFCSISGIHLCQPSSAASAACFAVHLPTTSSCNDGCTPATGTCVTVAGATTVWERVVQLNLANFAGHSDWRVPTVSEMQTLLDYDALGPPLVNSAFNRMGCVGACPDASDPTCSCTRPDGIYWSASLYPFSASGLGVEAFGFSNGGTGGYDPAGNLEAVRAVRGGS